MPSLVYLWINIAQTQRNSRCVRVRVKREVSLGITPASHVRWNSWRGVVTATSACVLLPTQPRPTPSHDALRRQDLCLHTASDISIPSTQHSSFSNANCLRISNEPLKYRTQWLRPPEAKAAGTRARNAVNESPSGRGWARFNPGNDFLQIMENFLMKAARRCPFKDLGARRIYGPNGRRKFCSSRRSLSHA